MADRYRMAQAKGKRHFQAAVEEDTRLLASFGLGLLSVSNGLRVVRKKSLRGDRVNPWDVIEVNARFWRWLRPLLIELHDLRAAKVNGVNGHAKNGQGVNGVNGVTGRGGDSIVVPPR